MEITGSRDVRFGEWLSDFTGYDANIEVTFGPQLGINFGKLDIQGGGNAEVVNWNLSSGLEMINSSNIQMNIFAEGKRSGIGAGFEANFSGGVNRMGETLSYEAGVAMGSLVGQIHGTLSPQSSLFGVSTKLEERRIGLKAIIGFKITIIPTK
ncbi:MAG: hypothetical protein IPM47_11575 [Sphingobacteriales bacterium]|nr:MAG: hypothetical protein IPM47_11575 [Sphingobacteriales bacterium]